MKINSLFSSLLILWLISGCTAAGPSDEGGESPTSSPLSMAVEDILDCEKVSSNVEYMLDPLFNHFLLTGAPGNVKAMKECLKDRHGWIERGPPKFMADVMAPPRRAPQPRTTEPSSRAIEIIGEGKSVPAEPVPLNINMRMFCAVSENGRRFSVYVDNRNYGDRTCRASCSYTDRGQDGVLACSGTVPAQANRMILCTKYARESKFVFTDGKTLACD
jgi:hypothetical protein